MVGRFQKGIGKIDGQTDDAEDAPDGGLAGSRRVVGERVVVDASVFSFCVLQ